MMTSTRLKALAAVLIAAVFAYWYGWSPAHAVRQMQAAAQARDAVAFNEHVDYPRVRDSLKQQLSGAVSDRLEEASSSGDEFARAGASLGAMLGHAVAGTMVEAFVRPQTLMRAMREGTLSPGRRARRQAPASGQAAEPPEVVWAYERKGVDQYLAHFSRPGEPEGRRVTLVLSRSGFATWRLTEIRLPPGRHAHGG